MFEGCRGFMLTEETATTTLSKMFPDLNGRQVAQASRRLQGRAKAHLRGLERTGPVRRSWKDRY